MCAPFDKDSYRPLNTFGFEALTVAGTAVGFTPATYSAAGGTAMSATVRVEVAPVRYRADGTDPTTTVGELLDVGEKVVVWGSSDIAAIKFIRTGDSATLSTHFAR